MYNRLASAQLPFLPLLVAAGAAEAEPGTRNYHESGSLGGFTTSSGYRFGALR